MEYSSLLITGSNGFVGTSLLDFFVNNPSQINFNKLILVNRSAPKYEIQKLLNLVEVIQIHQNLESQWDFTARDCAVINLAADGSMNSYSEEAALSFEKIGKNFISWAKKNSPSIIFHASSGAAGGIKYLNHENSIKFDEKILNIKSRFIESRLNVERDLENLAEENISVIIGRLYSFVGRNLMNKNQYAVTQLIKGAIHEKKIDIKGNPQTIRSYLHENDMSNWICKSLSLENKFELLTIGSSIPVTIQELASHISSLTGASLNIGNSNATGDVYIADNRQTLDILRTSETIGWKESVEESIGIVRGD